MKGRTLTAILLLFALVITCLVSAPVLSSEHPWDADNGDRSGDGRDGERDTVVVPQDFEENPGHLDWRWYAVYASSYYFSGQLVNLVIGTPSN